MTNPDPVRIRIRDTVTDPSYFSLYNTFKEPNPPVGVPLGEEELAGLDVGVGPRHQTLRHAGAQRQRLTATRACALENLSTTILSDRRVFSVLQLYRLCGSESNVADPGCLSIFFHIRSQCFPSRVRKELSILTQKIVSKLSKL
jgi:hypothetical protein